MIDLKKGDCLDLMKQIPDGSVDLILTDPPYGTMKGANLDGWDNGTKTDWDTALDTNKTFAECSRILRQNGKAVLFAQEPYTSKLITEAISSLPFSYRAMWLKNNHANPLMAKSAMVSRYEDICIFQKMHDAEGVNELRDYFKRILKYVGIASCKQINEALGHRRAEHCFYVTGFKNGSTQFSLCTEAVYCELIKKLNIGMMDGFLPYSELKKINFKYESRFNLWQGGKSKSNVLEYAKDSGGFHPTQKPVLLLEDLIKTFSNVGDTVLDFTMGSGSTGVACQNTNRSFIGIEMDDRYFEIAKKRVKEASAKQLQIGGT